MTPGLVCSGTFPNTFHVSDFRPFGPLLYYPPSVLIFVFLIDLPKPLTGRPFTITEPCVVIVPTSCHPSRPSITPLLDCTKPLLTYTLHSLSLRGSCKSPKIKLTELLISDYLLLNNHIRRSDVVSSSSRCVESVRGYRRPHETRET